MEDFRQFNFEILLIKWYKFMRKNMIFILIISVLGALLGFGFHKLSKPYYGSKAIVYSSLVKDFRIEQIIEDLSVHLQKKNFKVLAKKLNMSQEQVQQIKAITTHPIEVHPSLKTDPNSNFNEYLYNCMEVSVLVHDTSIIRDFQKGLTFYLGNNQFLSKIHGKRADNLKMMIRKIDEQIKALEELQVNNINREDSKATVINNDINSTSRDMVYLMEERTNYEEELSLDVVEYIKPFIIPAKPESKMLILIAAGLIVGFLLGTGIAVLREINSKI